MLLFLLDLISISPSPDRHTVCIHIHTTIHRLSESQDVTFDLCRFRFTTSYEYRLGSDVFQTGEISVCIPVHVRDSKSTMTHAIGIRNVVIPLLIIQGPWQIVTVNHHRYRSYATTAYACRLSTPTNDLISKKPQGLSPARSRL